MSSTERRDDDPADKDLQRPIHDDERAELEAANRELHARRAREASKTNRHEDDDAPFSRLQRLAAEASEDDDQARPATVSDPQALDREAERHKTQIQERDRRDREQREQRARERAVADARNKEAMQAQREADTSEAWRRVEEARARAARKNSHDEPAATNRKRKTRKRRRRKAAAEKLVLPTERELLAALMEAETDDEICAGVARWCWVATHDGDEKYAKRIPSWNELIAWWNRDGSVLKKEEHRVLSELLGTPAFWSSQLMPGPRVNDARVVAYEEFKVFTLADVHRRWKAATPLPLHPLVPMVDAWQQSVSMSVVPDQRSRAIIPRSLRDAARNQETLPLALDRQTPLGPVREYEQGYLPGLNPPKSLVPPVPWLTLYDLTATGPMQTRGRGAPLAQRLFVEVLTAIGIHDREWIAAPPITLRDLFEWCWPRYYDAAADRMRGGYQRSKHLELLRRALVELDNMRIEHGRYERRLIRVDDLPTPATALDDPIRFHVRHLPDSDRGPMIERTSTRRWGVVSAPTWRSTIRLAYLWDETKGRNNGARVYATRPVVARGHGGALLGADGKPLRDRRGAVVTDWSDDRAVILGADGKPASDSNPPAYERNPAADRVPELGPDDLIRLAFDNNITSSNRRERLRLARKALMEKEAAGEVVIERAGNGWRIIESMVRAEPDTC